jgi:DNA sulfur modification protein DndB
MSSIPTLSFAAIRGIQANRVYYTAMWSYGLMSKITIFDDPETDAFSTIQRKLNEGRIPEMKDYILKNRDTYVFSAITASIDKDVDFMPSSPGSNTGILTIPMDAKFVVNDGQHRRKAIMEALREDPSLAEETISVVFFVNVGTKRSQQMFADLNGKGVKTGRAINALFNHRDHFDNITRELVRGSEVLRKSTDFQKTSLSRRSKHLFTYSGIGSAVSELMKGAVSTKDIHKDISTAREYFAAIISCFPQWEQVADDRLSAAEVREISLATSGVILHAFGRIGNELLTNHAEDWKSYVTKIRNVNFERAHPDWVGRAIIQDKISKSSQSILTASAYIKRKIGLAPDNQELAAEADNGLS